MGKEMRTLAESEGHNDPQHMFDDATIAKEYQSSTQNINANAMNTKEEQEYEPSSTYVKGFNEGYAIAKYLPEVAESLSDILGTSERAQGFQLGRNEFLTEKEMEKVKDIEMYPDWLLNDFVNNLEDLEKDADKDDIEPEL